MTLTIILISLGTGFSYLLVAAIYLIVCYILIKSLKKLGVLFAAVLCILMVLQISHWYKLEVESEKLKAELVERSPEIYTLLSEKFEQFDKNQDGQIDSQEMTRYKTTCSCNASTLSYLNANLETIGDLRQVSGSDSLMFTIDRKDLENLKRAALENLKRAALESFQMTQ